ncbi:hypothetical protein HHK36_016414 [Tetracentron sinense]|uniref:Phorbol-ester/DAG-type domain-containing protein n=1 Tax=Tetracentron sinense TaxID=13715 RepID=A0A834Z0A1_TETSI|nr:hypothetical protein HHK36_016414 [Tetracentron sinense]
MIYTELPHSSHPEHLLTLVHCETPYKCDGCKERGFGLRYRCEACNFDLHKDCIFSTPTTSHAFYKKCSFKFFDHPPGERTRWCDACGRSIQGFVYHCEKGRNLQRCCKTGRDLHPCCHNLPSKIEVNGVKCYLREKVSSKCVWCGKKKHRNDVPGWSYLSTSKDYHFHVSCVTDMLVQNWEKGHLYPRNAVSENSLALENRIPNLQLTAQANTSTNSGRSSKYWRIAKLVLKTIIGLLIHHYNAEEWVVELASIGSGVGQVVVIRNGL